MNIVLESAVEIIGGQPVRNYGRVLLRGNKYNIMYVFREVNYMCESVIFSE
jgi:small nuclear ribonucleoprotein (snRNP)-like protein